MQEIIEGICSFRRNYYKENAELFRHLTHGQSPPYLFITCSDSRIDPTLITDTSPGELFVLRNAGNIVPPESAGVTGEAATIEYAVIALQVKHIIVCGHSHCGAMTAVLYPEHLSQLPMVGNFLVYSEKVRKRVESKYPGLQGEDRVVAAVKENVLVQLDHLRTLSSVAWALNSGQLQLHGWIYFIETGEVQAYDDTSKQYVSLGTSSGVAERSSEA
jgi:carbonic anhydrase